MRMATKAATLVVALLIIYGLLSVSAPAYAACSGSSNEWSWDPSVNKSCAPCSYNQTLTSQQKLHDSCSSSGGGVTGTGSGGHKYTAVRVYWQENTAESVSTYAVDWQRASSGYSRLIDINTPCDNSQCEFYLEFGNYGVNPGDEICFRIQATRWHPQSTSPWSDSACVVAEGQAAAVLGLSKPQSPQLDLN